jgi:hypothetical protein
VRRITTGASHVYREAHSTRVSAQIDHRGHAKNSVRFSLDQRRHDNDYLGRATEGTPEWLRVFGLSG